ncbi:MAG: sensory histidine kinase AtoS [Methanoregulaceae archaeon PtaB.Bin009]|nr:MAG: sensory histidine kinase AtoS [Methanoregulaceae archaeon PtaB.Bin009]
MEDSIRVLCVDDEPSLLALARMFLEKSGGFFVGTSTSAEEALDRHEIMSYDAIVSDYQMPGMDGIEFLKAVRLRFGDIPFILFTGRGREEVVIAAINNGADFYLQKGGDPKAQFAELAHKVRQAVRRKKAEVSLKESEEKYRMLVEHNRDGVFIVQDGKLVFYNNALTGLSRYTPEELEGMHLADLIAPEDREMVLSRAKVRAEGGLVPERYEFTLVHKDGIHRSRMRISTYLGSYQGRPASFGTFYDVTEDRRREAALRESEEKYRTILENIQDVYYRTDTHGNLIMLSRSGYRLLGYDRSENILGSSLAGTFYANPEDRRKLLEAISEKGAVHDYEVNFRHKDGSIITVSANSHYYYGNNGKIAGIEGIFRDITEQKRAGEDLKRSENLYRTVFEHTGTATILIGPDTTILKANGEWERLTGVPLAAQENILSWTGFIHQDDRERMKEYHYARRKDPAAAPGIYECRLVDAHGGIHYGFVHVGMIPGTGNSIASLVDVTALTQAQEDLKASERKIREILDHLPDLIVVHREGNILYVNPAMTESMGWQPDEVVGQPILKFIAPEFHAAVQDAARLRLESGIDSPYIINLINRDKKPLTVRVRGTVISVSGSPAIMNILTDITTVRNAEKALEESERKYRMLVENTNDIIYTTDLAGQITTISPQIRRYGYSPEEIVSENLTSFIVEEDLPRVIADFEKTVSTGQSTLTIFRVRDRSGTIHWFEDNGSALTDASGNVIGISGILRDITERKNAEEALRESEEKFSTVFRSSPVSLTLVSTKDGTCVDVNDAFVRESGYSREDVIGQKASEIGLFADPSESNHVFSLLETHGQVKNLEIRFRTKSGEIQTCLFSASVIHMGNDMFVLSGVENITARKSMENALVRANRQLNLLGGITRHDILNKVSVILGYLEIAKESVKDPELGGYLEKVESATRAIREQIEFMRLFRDIGTRAPEWISLDSALPHRHVPATISFHAEVIGVDILAEPMVERVFYNLLDNSVRHGGRVSAIRVSAYRSGDSLVIVWEDNGVGIASGEKERIFDRGVGKNTGLGLFLAREILSLTGITIRETGYPGTGARFEITVPRGNFRMAAE